MLRRKHKSPLETQARWQRPQRTAIGNRTQLLALSALRSDGRDANAWTYLGLADEHLGNNKKALQDFGQAVRLAPKATFAHNNYGAALEANGRSNEALAQYRASLQLDPEQPAGAREPCSRSYRERGGK